jgi:hypothetical protein
LVVFEVVESVEGSLIAHLQNVSGYPTLSLKAEARVAEVQVVEFAVNLGRSLAHDLAFTEFRPVVTFGLQGAVNEDG